METGEPQEARYEDQGQDLTKRHLDSSSSPGDPQSLLRNIQDLGDKVGLHASARHQTVHGLVQGNTVAAEGQQVGPLALLGEVLTAAERVGLGADHNNLTM